jgi:hypothetical protein
VRRVKIRHAPGTPGAPGRPRSLLAHAVLLDEDAAPVTGGGGTPVAWR